MGSPRGSDGFTTAEGWTFMIRIDWSASPGLGKIEIGQVQTRVSVRAFEASQVSLACGLPEQHFGRWKQLVGWDGC